MRAGKCNPPQHRESPCEEQTTLHMRSTELPSLTPSRSRGFPCLSAQARAGIPGHADFATEQRLYVACSFSGCLRNIYFDTVSLYMAQPRFGLNSNAPASDWREPSHLTLILCYSLCRNSPAWLPDALQWAPRPYPLCWLPPVTGDLTGQWAVHRCLPQRVCVLPMMPSILSPVPWSP